MPYDNRVDLAGRPHTGSIYATDTLSVGNALEFHAVRPLQSHHDRQSGPICNRRPAPGRSPATTSSTGSIPLSASPIIASPLLNAYFGYNEGSRAPTSIELGCADPTQPCKLPNALAGDPPLKQVVTRTFEAGVRGSLEHGINWSAGWFRGVNHDDLLFVASTQTGFGYFKNFGKTLRQGAGGRSRTRGIRRLTIGGGYTFLDATYQSPETVDGAGNSTNEFGEGLDGTIQIQPGTRIPLIPQHMLKAYLDLQATSKLSLDLGLVAVSSSYARGNENNLHQPDGVFYLGPGQSPGYAVLNLGAHYQVQRRLQLFIQVNNLADRRYYTAAQLGPTGFTANGNFIARQFPAVERRLSGAAGDILCARRSADRLGRDKI